MNSEESNTLEDYFTIFWNDYFQEEQVLKEDGRKLVYYTNADTAKKIIQNNEIWFRNASIMNDYSEISYGLEKMWEAFNSTDGNCLKTKLENNFEGIVNEINNLAKDQKYWKFQTYILSLSIHEPCELRHGRLSMWRAYGDVAIVLNTNCTSQQEVPSIYGSKIHYYKDEEFEARIKNITKFVNDYGDELKKLGRDGRHVIIDLIIRMIYYSAVYTKHIGFSEENEWRFHIYKTTFENEYMKREIETIGGIIQPVWKFRLDAIGGIQNILDRVIIGPTSYHFLLCDALIQLLVEANVNDAESMVHMSDIPLRKSN